MNASQMKYAMSRVTDIENCKLAALRIKLTTPGKSLTPAQRMDLLRKGLVPTRTTVTEIYSYTDVRDAFDFGQFEYGDTFDDVTFDTQAAEIKKQADTIRDQIMLGDEVKALKLLTDFSS